MPGDGFTWDARVRIEKYSPDQVAFAASHLASHGPTVKARSLLGHGEPTGAELRALCGDPEDGVYEEAGNLLVTVGLNLLTELFEAGGGTGFSHANAIVGVGAGTTAAAVGDTALTDDNSANAYYQQADSSYPQQSNGVITCQATFASGNANFAWQEWCLATGSGGITAGTHLSAVATGVTMINHKVTSLGTKVSGASWILQATCTIS